MGHIARFATESGRFVEVEFEPHTDVIAVVVCEDPATQDAQRLAACLSKDEARRMATELLRLAKE